MAGEEERPATAQDAKYELDHTKRHQAIPSLHGGHDGGAAQQRDRDLQDTVEVEAVQTADNASEYPPTKELATATPPSKITIRASPRSWGGIWYRSQSA